MKTALFYAQIVSLVIGLSFFTLNAQTYLMDGTPISDCGGFFQDSGGETAYEINESFTTTICSDHSINTHIQLNFSRIDIGEGDTFEIYDATTADPDFLIDASFLATPDVPFSIMATVVNPTGCLTIVFTSDAADNGMGWNAAISCMKACQMIIADFDTTPEEMPMDTGWVDICLGDTVAFSGQGFYPENGGTYMQSDETSTFEWTFGDGYSEQGMSTMNVYEEPGIYLAQLKITDQMGCENSNAITRRIRVSSYPSFINDDSLVQTICSGDTISINSSIDTLTNANITVLSNSGYSQQTLTVTDSLALPDGTGASYMSSLNFTQFEVGATMTSISDISNVSLTLEHSYTGDLDIELICPNGSSVYILEQSFGVSPGATNFGEPFASAPVDGQSSDLTLGIPYTYTFVEEAVNGTLDEFATNAPSYTYTTVPSQETGQTFTYTDRYFPAGAYQPEGSFSNLVGCPLNGEWIIRVQDNLSLDNGWLTEWGLSFAGNQSTSTETFTPVIIDGGWLDHPSIIASGQDFLLASPTGPATVDYIFWVLNDFGCLSETAVTFEVLSPSSSSCYEDDCQEIIPHSISVHNAGVTVEDAADWLRVCQGGEIIFLGEGEYPENGETYIQSDETSTFEWDFGDGSPIVSTGPFFLAHSYEEPGSYLVHLKITDNAFCESEYVITQTVHVSGSPNISFDPTFERTFCGGDTLSISTSSEPASTLIFSAYEGPFPSDLAAHDTIFITDGLGDFRSSLNIMNGNPDAVITSAGDLRKVNFTIEHSYVGDLDIDLICPNGQSITILDENVGSTNFGEPYITLADDNCLFEMGIPYTYSIVNITERGSFANFNTVAPTYTIPTCFDLGTQTDTYFPAGEYEAEESFFNLIGCPVNGQWSLNIRDNLAQDNGWLTGWEIEFAAHLYPEPETFSPEIEEWGWEDHPSIILSNADSLLVSPLESDTVGYAFWILDGYGCLYDTTFLFEVLSPDHPDCIGVATTRVIESDFTIAPNPVTSSLRLEIPDQKYAFSLIELFNTLGEVVTIQPIAKGHFTYYMDMVNLPSGVYYLRLRGEEFVSSLKKVVKINY